MMQAFRALVRRELGSTFVSWSGYAVIAAVVFLLGLCFVSLLQALNGEPTDRPITEVFYDTYYFWLVLLLVSPLLTMRSFALERASGTFETLLTTPVRDSTVVLAKFTGAMTLYLLAWLPLLAYTFIVRHFSHEASLLEPGALASTFLGIILLGGVYMALGCFASALCRSQIVAGIISLALGLSLFLLSFIAATYSGKTGWIPAVLNHVYLIEHMRDFARGIVDTRPVVFYLSLTGLFLYLTCKALESRRWK